MSYCYCSLIRMYILHCPMDQTKREIELPDESDGVLRLAHRKVRDDVRQRYENESDDGLPAIGRKDREDLVEHEQHGSTP